MNIINKILGKTFLVNLDSGEIHNMKKTTGNCHINLIAEHHKKYVTKKKVKMLMLRGFNGCRWCMPKEDIDKW